MTDLLKLAERVEAAEGADRNLDADIMRAVGQVGLKADYQPTPFTASIDAAMTLVPGPDWEWALEWETNSDGEMFARFALGDSMRFRDCEAKTLPLAICAGALRARASKEGQSNV